MKKFKLLIPMTIFSLLVISFQAFAFDEESTMEVLKRSQATRKELEKNLPQRDLASIRANEKGLAAEYKSLMADDQDKDWFNEVDKVIADD